jgi:hypothetical protein
MGLLPNKRHKSAPDALAKVAAASSVDQRVPRQAEDALGDLVALDL